MLQNLTPFDNRDKYLLHSMQVIETMEKMIKDILAAARTQMLQNNGGMRLLTLEKSLPVSFKIKMSWQNPKISVSI